MTGGGKHPSVFGYQPVQLSEHGPAAAAAATSRISRNFMCALLMGMTFGFSFAYLMISVVSWDHASWYLNANIPLQGQHYQQQHHHDLDLDPHSHELLDQAAGPSAPVPMHDHNELFHKGKTLGRQIVRF